MDLNFAKTHGIRYGILMEFERVKESIYLQMHQKLRNTSVQL
jgi:hypothetical protein